MFSANSLFDGSSLHDTAKSVRKSNEGWFGAILYAKHCPKHYCSHSVWTVVVKVQVKEISYIHSEAYAAGELKHGTISLIENGTLVIGILTQNELYEKTVSNMVECKSRGAYLCGWTVTNFYLETIFVLYWKVFINMLRYSSLRNF